MKILYFICCILQPICLPIPEAGTVLWASVSFGSFPSFFLGVTGSLIGITIMYWIVKRGTEFFLKKEKVAKKVKEFRQYVEKYRIFIVGLLFVVPILPDEIVCIGAVATGIEYPLFFMIAVLAKIISIGMISYSQKIAMFLKIEQSFVIIVEIAVVFFIAWGFQFKQKSRKAEC